MNYILVLTATLLYSSQFLMTQIYSKHNGKGLKATLAYNIGTYVIMAIYMFIANGLKLAVTPFSLVIAALASLNALVCSYAGIAALQKANLSLYSVFLMSGPLVISALTGFLFFKEGITLGVIIGILLIALSLYLSIDRSQKGQKGAVKYYFLCFLTNGLSGVFSKIHQSQTKINVPSNDYLILMSLSTILMSVILLLIITRGKKPFEHLVSIKNIGCMAGFSAFHGVAELLSLLTLATLPLSLQQPLITGGVLTFSFVISALRREKLTVKSFVSFVLALVATLCISLLTIQVI